MISYENVSLDEPFKPEKDSFITQNLTETRGQKGLILIQDYSVVLVWKWLNLKIMKTLNHIFLPNKFSEHSFESK